MKGKSCPYCGRRISYFTAFHKKKEGLYKCTRCNKESKIKTDFKMMLAFLGVVLLVVIYLVLWQTSGFYNNFLDVIPPIIIIVAFYFITPLFIRFAPLRKEIEKKEIKKEQLPEMGEESYGGDYVFNREVFEKAKQQRNSTPIVVDDDFEAPAEEEPYVPIIKDVSEAHASSDAPLKKVNHPSHERKYPEPETYEEDVKTYYPHQNKKPDGTKYTANRKF